MQYLETQHLSMQCCTTSQHAVLRRHSSVLSPESGFPKREPNWPGHYIHLTDTGKDLLRSHTELEKSTMRSGKWIDALHFKYTTSISWNCGERRFLRPWLMGQAVFVWTLEKWMPCFIWHIYMTRIDELLNQVGVAVWVTPICYPSVLVVWNPSDVSTSQLKIFYLLHTTIHSTTAGQVAQCRWYAQLIAPTSGVLHHISWTECSTPTMHMLLLF